MSAKLYLVAPTADGEPSNAELVRELEELLQDAKAGVLHGFAYVAMHSGPEFSINAVGSAKTIPAYSLGALRALEDYLFKLM
jgi:hypothetical protein